jgi:hypothetical protein
VNEQERTALATVARMDEIHARLSRPRKLTWLEREQVETALSNFFGCGEISADDYNATFRTLTAHA